MCLVCCFVCLGGFVVRVWVGWVGSLGLLFICDCLFWYYRLCGLDCFGCGLVWVWCLGLFWLWCAFGMGVLCAAGILGCVLFCWCLLDAVFWVVCLFVVLCCMGFRLFVFLVLVCVGCFWWGFGCLFWVWVGVWI